MDNQHKKITGYRDLSQQEIDAMNAVKAKAEEAGSLIEELQANASLDQRWVAIAKTDLQKDLWPQCVQLQSLALFKPK